MENFSLLLIVGIGVVVFGIIFYNRLVSLQNNRDNAFADIDVQLKQRHDLIPQLLETVKGYMKHEEKVLTEVTDARAGAMSAKTVDEKIVAEGKINTALGNLTVAMEAYPDLKASQNFQKLQDEISDIENKIAAARRFFNSATKEFNNVVEMFPSNIIAKIFGFKEALMFELGEIREKLETAPKITF